MPFRDILKRNKNQDVQVKSPSLKSDEFTFMRSDTNTQELISPPTFAKESVTSTPTKPRSRFRKSSNASTTSAGSTGGHTDKNERRLSQRLHLRSHSRSTSASSIHVPSDLPSITDGTDDQEGQEAQWEQRATLLAQGSSGGNSRPGTAPDSDTTTGVRNPNLSEGNGRQRGSSISDPKGDENIQEAIRLHEAGELQRSTAMFGRLADPAGANNALSQVLYGLALRHGWGCSPDPSRALHYLTLAAQNSAAIESVALKESGMKTGGAAKGELVLAIYELANCFRHGWGVSKKDPVAAKQYYETAANLGDVDAMNEVAWCYETGFGTSKNKAQAARYYRQAEQKGSKTMGNSWIWKEKYDFK